MEVTSNYCKSETGLVVKKLNKLKLKKVCYKLTKNQILCWHYLVIRNIKYCKWNKLYNKLLSLNLVKQTVSFKKQCCIRKEHTCGQKKCICIRKNQTFVRAYIQTRSSWHLFSFLCIFWQAQASIHASKDMVQGFQ